MTALLTACLLFEILVRALNCISKSARKNCRSFRLRWLNTVFDTSVSFTFSSKTLDPLVAKNGSKQVNNTSTFFIIKLTYVLLPWQHD